MVGCGALYGAYTWYTGKRTEAAFGVDIPLAVEISEVAQNGVGAAVVGGIVLAAVANRRS